MRFLLLFIVSLSNSLIINASEETNWAVSAIPANLMTKANAVVRNAETTVTVYTNGSVEENIKIATTIMNENAERFSYLVEFYDKYSSVSGIDGIVYDKNGKKIRKIRNDEILDVSAIAGFSIYDDNRLKVVNPKVGDYPYTVVYEYRKKYKSFFAMPGWQVYNGYNVSVQNSSFTLTLEPGAKVNFRGNEAFTIQPVVTEVKGLKTYRWVAQNQPAIEEEPWSAQLTEFTPVLRLAPEKFEMDGYNGSNASWAEFGEWAYKLGRNRSELPQPTIEKIKGIVSDAGSDYEKARRLYEYMQNKVRYVSIQVGIGGFQPFQAETVDRLSYGDCKALTNYMKSLLEIVGIKSYYCLVKAGDDSPNIDKYFVCSQFNHAFLMLPIASDTLYLECTSQQVPFGYNGTFTDDRDVLVIDSTRSYIKHTNIYGKDKNKTVNTFTFSLSPGMDCNVSQKSDYIGVASENVRYLMEARAEKQREHALKRWQLRQVKINRMQYNEKKDVVPVITENIEFYVPQVAQITGSGILIPFNQVTRMDDLKRVTNRKSDVLIRRSEMQVDSIRYVLPPNMVVDKLPVSSSFATDFGSYKLEVISDNNTVTFVRTLEWRKGRFEPDRYAELMQFQRKINEMDRQVMVLQRK
jgi:hypothetical protein